MGQPANNIAQFPTTPIEEGYIPHIPPGVYTLAFETGQTWVYFGRSPKVVMWFRVVSYGPHFGAVLPRYYNVKQIKGKPRKNGEFKAGPSSDLVREYARIFNTRPRLDRISFSQYKGISISGRVETVQKDREQKELPEVLHYSVINELLGKEQ